MDWNEAIDRKITSTLNNNTNPGKNRVWKTRKTTPLVTNALGYIVNSSIKSNPLTQLHLIDRHQHLLRVILFAAHLPSFASSQSLNLFAFASTSLMTLDSCQNPPLHNSKNYPILFHPLYYDSYYEKMTHSTEYICHAHSCRLSFYLWCSIIMASLPLLIPTAHIDSYNYFTFVDGLLFSSSSSSLSVKTIKIVSFSAIN